MSGGANAIAGAIERQQRRLVAHTGLEPMLLMTGGAATKVRQSTELPFETVDALLFEGLLLLQQARIAHAAATTSA